MTTRLGLSLLASTLALVCGAAEPAAHPNIVFITADDLNFDSLGCYGCPIADITPHLDRLAADGMRFDRAYSTVAVCQPVRQTMLTGLYPHRSGSMGFLPVKPGVRTLNQQMREAGYLMGMLGKNAHYQPREQFVLDYEENQISRQPEKLAQATRTFIGMARAHGKPFLHFVNCTDPHRPFITGPDDLANGAPPSRFIRADEIAAVPGFLEDLPGVRRELSHYFTSVRRLDDCVGAVLGVLDELGLRDDTLVIFYGGDHGMALPFAKTNCYEDSSRGSLLVRWPGRVPAGKVDERHFVSTLDFTPTLLDAAAVPPIPGMDGRSFLPLLEGGEQDDRDRILTFYNQTSGNKWLPMRCLRTPTRSYIWNAWSDGTTRYSAENMVGLTWKAMLAAAETDPRIKARTDFYLHRVPEEFYDLTGDRYERGNLIDDPARQAEIEAARAELLAELRRIGDPLAEAFARRADADFVSAELAKLAAEYGNARPPRKATQAKAAARAASTGEASATGQQRADKPNILVLIVDDLGWADVGFNGSREIPTPHLDSLAANGVRCTAGYVTAPQCSPSRAGLLTGRYQQRFGHDSNHYHLACFRTGQRILPEHLQAAGYATGMVGKWHLGLAPEHHPQRHGFDEFYGFQGGGHAYRSERPQDADNPLQRGTTPVRLDGGEFLTTAFGREAAAFIRRHAEEPWFLYTAFNAPHVPMTMPPGYEDKVAHIPHKLRRLCAAMTMNLDDAVGDILAALRDTDQEERTLVVFLSDNGGTATPDDVIKNGSLNVPYRGVKGDLYDGGIRVPFVFQWKGRLPAGRTVAAAVTALDILPTALAAAGAPPLPGTALEGVNLLPFLRGESQESPHDVLFWRWQSSKAVRQADWKWVVNNGRAAAALYDLAADPSEQHDLAAREPERVEHMAALFDAWDATNPPLDPEHFIHERGPKPRARAKAAAGPAGKPR
jgi:N-sulfoglucosamine sulfohydrolase